MSKIEAGRVSFTPSALSLPILLDMLEEMFKFRASEKGLQFVIERDPTLPCYIETDENKLRQVLINLVGNAIKFTKFGQVILRVKSNRHWPIKTTSKTQELQELGELELTFAVEDTGFGIEPEEIESLFEPFIQSSNRQISQEGTGLGLPISRQFVQLMGGDLTVESTLGVGSSFTFSIPVRLTEVSELDGSAQPRSIIGLEPNQPPYRILVVEDNDPNRELLVQLLHSIGLDVQTATNGQEAIALWKTWHPQLIWMDMRMPLMDGYEATRRIRAMESQNSNTCSPTIIIALTANAFEEDRTTVLAIGCNDFIRKPYQESELLEKMAHYLDIHYLYADVDERIDTIPAAEPVDMRAALRSLPASWLAQFHQATLQLDSQKLATLIEEIIAVESELGTFLTERLEDFDFEPILNLIQEVL
jgi:CheY-like chemotaxis protein